MCQMTDFSTHEVTEREKIDKSTVLARDFNTLSTLIEQVEKNKDVEDLKIEAEGIFFNLFL